MGSEPGLGPIDVKRLSIEELLECLPETKIFKERDVEVEIDRTPVERAVLDELWSRHYKFLRRRLRKRVCDAGSTLCPPQEPVRDNFIDEVLDRTYDEHLRLTVKGEFTSGGLYKNFFSYLNKMVLNQALSYRRFLTGQRKVKIKDSSGRVVGEKLVGTPKPIPGPLDECPDTPNSDATLDPVRIRIRQILDTYPPEHAESYRNLDRIIVEGWSYEELADLIPGPGTRAQKIEDIVKFEKENRAELKIRLRGYEGASLS